MFVRGEAGGNLLCFTIVHRSNYESIAKQLPALECYDSCEFCKAPVTPGLRPGYDLPATEKWGNRRKNVRLVAEAVCAEVVRLIKEVVGDRKGQISRSMVMVMFKTQSHRAYDQVTTYLRSKNVAIVDKSKKECTTGCRGRTIGRRGRG